jgi:uncharacterized membrane-anchored protein
MPTSHPLRTALNEEVHARPAAALMTPCRVSCLAFIADDAERAQAHLAVQRLASLRAMIAPMGDLNHFAADFGDYQLIWERHTEFWRIIVLAPLAGNEPFGEPALSLLPAEWVSALPGQLIVAAHVALVSPAPKPVDFDLLSTRYFAGNVLMGAEVAGGNALALIDFRLQADEFSRFWIEDRGLSAAQAGRTVQRLLEIEIYRTLALLALPEARRVSPLLQALEQKLKTINTALVNADEAHEPLLLDQLTDLAAEVESLDTATRYRFNAANAYWSLVQRRIAELREVRIEGLQTLQEFIERRVAPGLETCRSVASRQEGLGQRVARATQLLSTRVEITRERQNTEVLAAMNRRAALQLRLQETVEGLSLAAITYYFVGLLGYLAKGANAFGFTLDAEKWTGFAVPVVAALGILALQRARRRLQRRMR